MTNNDVRLEALKSAATFDCMRQYNDMLRFFNDATHSQACYDAYVLYGLPPANDTPLNIAGLLFKTCSWQKGMYRYYLAAKLLYRYPSFDLTDKNNCKRIKDTIDALEGEKLNADNQFVSDNDTNYHTYQLSVINDLQNNLTAAYANMSCSTVINNDQQQQTIATIDAATTTTNTGSSNTTNKLIYVVAAILVIVIIYKILKA